MPEEKRVDTEDKTAYTYSEILSYYKGKYKKADIKAYWETLKVSKESKAAAKAKAKAKEKAKAKAKAKEKAKDAPPKKPKPQRVIKVGAKFPNVDLHLGFPPEKINMPERLKGKKVIVVGLPGAFTPC
eukprot:gnl/MRDRNA2_/MRDRNA2_90532_c0_seq1.p2 gnl/MRDRNA2_/MRDRNA2_90532_c0~~gnl/MRDRNA2_/MRDRNA2_90532_c0_seq1.p2  ORF type:complete len:128 (+),score=40.80 gnl/MRDRNA2_/MRDRNA2_90532_c0_seq1:101-484(+)